MAVSVLKIKCATRTAFLWTCRLHPTRVVPAVCLAYSAQRGLVTEPRSRSDEKSSVVPVFRHAEKYSDKVAIRDRNGDFTYKGIFGSSRILAKDISTTLKGSKQERVTFLCPNDVSYVITQWACWMSGQIAVPLSKDHPIKLLEYYIRDSQSTLIITTPEYADAVLPLATELQKQMIVLEEELWLSAQKQPKQVATEEVEETEKPVDQESFVAGLDDEFYGNSDAMILYTSGTTGSPKGVVLTYANLESHVRSMLDSWGWSSKDNILHTLPLHHMHGIVNVLLCPLYVGARCTMLPQFETSAVWSHLLSINVHAADRINIFMAVPTIYARLIEEHERIFRNPRMQEYIRAVCSQKIRLMVSGSAPLPVPVFEHWHEITGHRLLERYGMTEIGMALSNPLIGERRPAFVGVPLPGVRVRLAQRTPGASDEKYRILCEGSREGTQIDASYKGEPGELLVKGPNVFRCYWNRPEATKKEFTEDGWFKTGDTAQYVNGAYKLLGRTSVDMIKTGGYRVSALEVETCLLGHPHIADCAVVGLPDITWGNKVAAVVVPKIGKEVILSQVREWAKEQMAPYAIPTVLKCVDKMPRNNMGKVNKPELLEEIFKEEIKLASTRV